ncbi:MAG TPA: SH3 domain-containing protein, partial [Gammaproteobacteria bacterium]|nr:SH3 domain-containing protein [Gammaproteobacteria bacterium]
KPLLTAEMQKKHMDLFYDHYFGNSSPWDAEYVNLILQQPKPNDLKTIEQGIIDHYSNDGKSDSQIGYGENFRPYAKDWIEAITDNIHIAQFDEFSFQTNNRGIAIDNLHGRALPTEDVHFYSHKIAGEGYPFDNLQIAALWAGTPVYILGETRDHAWMIVITPDYIGWVKSSGIARTDNSFVATWMKAAKNKLIAITQTQTSLLDENGKFLLLTYVGAVFPSRSDSTIMVPVVDVDRNAVIKNAVITKENAALMPMNTTLHHFSKIMRTMLARTYGWGSMYFYNDCSAELKSLFTPFGVWLPRHSSQQITIGKMVDMTAATAEDRLSYLMNNGQPFLTVVYLGGHVFLYIGNYVNPHKSDSLMAMTYQNMWGLSPNPANRRAVIGKSVLFPMLLQYPEDTDLVSQANKKFFQVSYLNQLSNSPQARIIDLKLLMAAGIL